MSSIITLSINFNVYSQDTPGFWKWRDAVEYCNNLGDGWRLPTIYELEAMSKNNVKNIVPAFYWSESESDIGDAYVYDFRSHGIFHFSKQGLLRFRMVKEG